MDTFIKRISPKRLWIVVVVILVILALLGLRQWFSSQANALAENLLTEEVARGELVSYVEADGVVRAEQSAELTWGISGTVAQVNYQVGDAVQAGALLATLEETSLPQSVILAQADLIAAQQALDDLLHSQTQRAQALMAVQEAEDALEDAQYPELAQAQAQAEVAAAQRQLESAQRRYDILTTPPSAAGIQQVYDNILLTQERIVDLEDQVADLEQTLQRKDFQPFESLVAYKESYAAASAELARQQDRLQTLQTRHAELLAPPDPLDVAVAEADLATAKAQFAEAQREWERLRAGYTPGEMAVLEAELADAQREYARVKDGPTTDDIAAAEARVAAAQSALAEAEIRAPFDAVVTQANLQPGDQVNAGAPAFRLDKLEHLLVDVQVSELDINRVAVGQPALLTFDAVLATEYPGVVRAISPVGATQDGVITFEVTIEITTADEVVRPGLTASVQIEVSRVADALLVPNQAMRSVNGQRVVYVWDESDSVHSTSPPTGSPLPAGVAPVALTLGHSSSFYSEVLDGQLQSGDLVVINPPSEWLRVP